MKLLLSHASPPVTAQVFSSEPGKPVPLTHFCATTGSAHETPWAQHPACGLCSQPRDCPSSRCTCNKASHKWRFPYSFHCPLCPWSYLHRTHVLIQIFSFFNLFLHRYCHDFEIWYWRRMCLWCTDDKFYIWINVQELVQRKEWLYGI